MKHYALYNPLSGNQGAQDRLGALADHFGGDIICKDITKIENYKDFLESIDESDVLVICGGDGTLNRFINDTDSLDIKQEILYMAIGTGNDFLHDIGGKKEDAPVNIKKYLKNLPLVEVNGKKYRFLNNVGFGIDGYCCEVGDGLKKKSTKPVNYTAIAIKGLLFHFEPKNATVIVDSKEYSYKKVWIAPTMKGKFYGGGMMPTPSQDRCASDGSLSVMLFHGKGRLRTLMAFPSIFKGEHIKHKNMVKIHTGTEIAVKFHKPCALQIDGETILGVSEYKAYAHSHALAASK